MLEVLLTNLENVLVPTVCFVSFVSGMALPRRQTYTCAICGSRISTRVQRTSELLKSAESQYLWLAGHARPDDVLNLCAPGIPNTGKAGLSWNMAHAWLS